MAGELTMTDREKLIELLGADTCTDNDCCDDCVYHENEEACIQHLKATMADHLISNGVGFLPKWIPVTERLPERFGSFAVVVKKLGGKMYSDFADYDPYEERWSTSLVRGIEDIVTHWMPLPQPPKGE